MTLKQAGYTMEEVRAMEPEDVEAACSFVMAHRAMQKEKADDDQMMASFMRGGLWPT